MAVHAGEERQKFANAITDPIFCASTYTFADTQSVIDFIEQKQPREEYGRYGNPSEKVVERKLAALEGGEIGAAVLQRHGGHRRPADGQAQRRRRSRLLRRVLSPQPRVLHASTCRASASTTRQVPACDYDAMEAAITPRTRLLVSESPTNPHLSVVDLERFAALGAQARRRNADRCHAGHALQPAADRRRHRLRAALGHQVPGRPQRPAGRRASSARREKLEPVRKLRGIMGSVNSPHNIYLLARGLKTFELRMQRHNENGLAVAEFLAVASADRAGLLSGPGSRIPYHEVAKRTMRGFGGLVTFLVKDADWRQTAAVVDAVRIPRIAPSLGGVESLIEQPLVMSYYECTPEERQQYGIPDNMIRLACGIENSRRPGGRPEAGVGPLNARHVGRHQRPCNFAREPFMSATSPIRKPAPSCRRSIWRPRSSSQAAGEWGEFDYSRSGNPTRKAFETTLAALEGGVGALGLFLRHGRHALRHDAAGQRRARPGRHRYLRRHLSAAAQSAQPRRASASSLVPSGDLAAVEAAITPQHQDAVDRIAGQSADVDHRHRGLRRNCPSARRCCWASTTRSPRRC